MKRLHKNNKGFALIEATASIMVLSIGLIGIALLQSTSTSQNMVASQITEATMVGLDQIEQILSWPSNSAGLADNDNVAFQRTGILGDITAGSGMINTVADTADFQVNTSAGYTIFYDGEPVLDAGGSGNTVAIDFRLFVTWNEGTNLRTVEMNFTKLLAAG